MDRLAWIVFVFVLVPAAQAQQRGKGGRPQAPPRTGKPAPKEPESKDIRLRAEKQESLGKGHLRASGLVDLRVGENRIQSDVLDYYQEQRPDGSPTRRIVATGNVVFLRGEERIAGTRLEMDLESGIGTFAEAVGYLQPGVFVEARIIERLDATTYRVHGARFSSCSQPNPRWGFTASSGTIHVDDKVVAKNVALRVKSVPFFYLPYFLYPIGEDQRSTGFLLPHVGYSSTRGFLIGEGFFWAMGRSFDQTFYADHYTNFGEGLGHELRYALDGGSRGTFRSYVFKQKGGSDWDYDLDYNAVQSLPAKLRATLNVRRYSSTSFQQQIQDGLNQASIRSARTSFNVQGGIGSVRVQAMADSTSTFWGDDYSRINQHLPSVRIQRFPAKLGKTPIIFGFEAKGEYLGLGGEVEAEEEGKVLVERYSRFDVSPELSLSLATPYLSATPRAAVRYSRYGARRTEEGEPLVEEPLTRSFFEGGVDIRGPMFSRIFNNPGKWYTDKFKHVIGPEVSFLYRTKVKDFDQIPRFDMDDYHLGTNEVRYSLVQRFYGRRPSGPGGKLAPYEFLNWRVTQTYYVQIGDNQNEFDPNYSSAAFGPGGVPSHYSPIQSRMRFKPTRTTGINFDVEYNTSYHQIRTLTVGATLRSGRVTFTGNWSRNIRLTDNPDLLGQSRDFLRASARIDVVPNKLEIEGDTNYDFFTKTMLQSRARIRYGIQCCAIGAEMIQYQFNDRVERRFTYFIELANIGTIGNFMGEDPTRAGGAGFGGPR